MSFNFEQQPSHSLVPYQSQRNDKDPFGMGWVLRMDEQNRILKTNVEFTLTPDQISVHMAVLGGSGTGKSKFIELLLRQYMIDGQGFFFFDPHGDTAKDLLAFSAAHKAEGDDKMWRRVHYLKVGPDAAFSYDPFAHAPLRKSKNDVFYRSWLDTKVQFLCRAILRRFAQSDVDAMNRMLRWMENVLFLCGTAYDNKNSHNGFDKMLIATNPDHPEFTPMLDRVFPFLRDDVQQDFIALRSMAGRQKVQQREKWVESTINNLRQIISTLLLEVFSQRAPAINIPEIMRQGGFIVADLSETGYWGHAQKTMLGGLLIQEVLHAKYVESELIKENRGSFALVIDEVGEFLGDDLERALGATRKFNLPIILAGQDLSTFAKGDFDMAAKVLSMCGTVVCFQNTYKDDKDILIDRVGTGNLNFKRRVVEVQRQRGLLKMITKSVGKTQGGSESWNMNWSKQSNESWAQSIGQAIGLTENWSESESHSDGRGESESEGTNENVGTGSSVTRSPLIKDGKVHNHTPVKSNQISGTRGKQSSHAKNHQESDTWARMRGGARTVTMNKSDSASYGTSQGESGGISGGKNWGEVHTEHESYVPNIVSEYEEDGQLEAGPVDVQKEMMKQQLHTLGVGQAIVACRFLQQAFVAQIAEVREWWANGRDKQTAIERIKTRLHSLHPYYFDPQRAEITEENESAPDVSGSRGRLPVDTPDEAEKFFTK